MDTPCGSASTALIVAVEHGHQDIVSLLIESGAAVNGAASHDNEGNGGGNAASTAARAQGKRPANNALEDHLDDGERAYPAGAGAGAGAGAAIIGNPGASSVPPPPPPARLPAVPVDAVVSPLMQAIRTNGATLRGIRSDVGTKRNRNVALVEILLKAKANVNDRSAEGITPLYLAAEVGTPELVTLLLKYGAGPSVLKGNREEMLPIVVASTRGEEKIVKILLEFNRTQDHVDSTMTYHRTKITPLIAAARGKTPNHAKVAKLLLASNASVNKWDAERTTPLSIAVAKKDIAMVRQLLYAGADTEIRTFKQFGNASPLDRACTQVMTPVFERKMLQLLIAFGSDTAQMPEGKPFYTKDPECPIIFALKCRMHKELLAALRANVVHPLRKQRLSLEKRVQHGQQQQDQALQLKARAEGRNAADSHRYSYYPDSKDAWTDVGRSFITAATESNKDWMSNMHTDPPILAAGVLTSSAVSLAARQAAHAAATTEADAAGTLQIARAIARPFWTTLTHKYYHSGFRAAVETMLLVCARLKRIRVARLAIPKYAALGVAGERDSITGTAATTTSSNNSSAGGGSFAVGGDGIHSAKKMRLGGSSSSGSGVGGAGAGAGAGAGSAASNGSANSTAIAAAGAAAGDAATAAAVLSKSALNNKQNQMAHDGYSSHVSNAVPPPPPPTDQLTEEDGQEDGREPHPKKCTGNGKHAKLNPKGTSGKGKRKRKATATIEGKPPIGGAETHEELLMTASAAKLQLPAMDWPMFFHVMKFLTRADFETTKVKPLTKAVRPTTEPKIRRRALQKHLKFNCTLCDAVYNRKDNLVTHMRKAHNIAPPKKMHLLGIPSSGPPFKCTLCKSVYNRRDNLVSHRRRKHEAAGIEGGKPSA